MQNRSPWAIALALSLVFVQRPVVLAQTESEAIALLASPRRDDVRTGLETLGLSATPTAVTAIANRVRLGLDAELLDLALTTLRIQNRPEAGPVLVELARHRRTEIRARALEAVAACRPAGARDVLVRGLSDLDATVRAAAATGLGDLEARDAVPALILALEHGVAEAALPIGKLGNQDEVRVLVTLLGRVPFATVSSGVALLLARADLPARFRLDLVAKLHELGTGEVRTFLEETLPSVPGGANDPVRRAIDTAIVRISG
jgi:hypothetical protein